MTAVETVTRLQRLSCDLARLRRLVSGHQALTSHNSRTEGALPVRARMLAHLRVTLDVDALLKAGYTREQIAECESWLSIEGNDHA